MSKLEMTIGSKIHSTLRTSRKLTDEEVSILKNTKYLKVYEFQKISNSVYPLQLDFEYFNKWVYDDGRLYIDNTSDEFFFIETLQYLIRVFFNPIGVTITGFVMGIDEIFGDYFSYYISESKIYIDIETVLNLQTYVYSQNKLENINIVFNQIIKRV
jgi:hypothetical protein